MRWFKKLFIFKAFILNKTGYKAQLEQNMRHFSRISYVGHHWSAPVSRKGKVRF